MKVKKILWILPLLGVLACERTESVESEFTGNEVVYTLFSGSDWDFYGEVSIKERSDGNAQIVVTLDNTEGPLEFPVHLHYNSYDAEADLAALLSPLSAETGMSITDLDLLANEQPITYEQLIKFNGHIKIHLDNSLNKDVILAYGNIGANSDKPIDASVAPCFDLVK